MRYFIDGTKLKDVIINLTISMDASRMSTGQLNSSSSKMKYSFPKTQRFDSKRYDTSSPNKFYQLPEIKSKRAAGFGYGSKMDMSKQNFLIPGAGTYSPKGSFDDKKGLSMALGRQKILVGDMFHENFKKPGPSDYSPEKLKRDISYSMSYRNPDLSDKWIKGVPGPGTYSTQRISNNQLKSNVSKFTSAPSTRFSHEQRLSEAELRIKNLKTPGPNNYDNSTQISKKFNHKGGSKFPHSNRPPMANTNLVPGPGCYNRASDFS